MTQISKIAPPAIAALLLLTSCGTSTAEAESADSLPVDLLFADYTPIPSAEAWFDTTDAVFIGTYTGEQADWDYRAEQEIQNTDIPGREYVGLSFNDIKVIEGSIDGSDEVTAGFPAYNVNQKTKKRRSELSWNGVSVSGFNIGDRYLLSIWYDEAQDRYNVGRYDAIQSVAGDGSLTELGGDDIYEGLGVKKVKDLEEKVKEYKDKKENKEKKPK